MTTKETHKKLSQLQTCYDRAYHAWMNTDFQCPKAEKELRLCQEEIASLLEEAGLPQDYMA